MLLSTYVNKQLIIFAQNLYLASENKDEDAIHDLRVALKKVFAIRNILKVTIQDYDQSIKPYFKPIRGVFKTTGIIRDHQILLHNANLRLPKREFTSFRRTCKTKIKSTHSTLIHNLNSIPIKKEISKVTKVFSILDIMRPDFIVESTLNIITNHERNIEQELLSPNCNFHDIRRWVKEQLYLYTLLKDVYKQKIKDSVITNKKQLGSKLGDWHDLRVLHHHWVNSKDSINNDYIKKLENEAHLLLNSIKNELKLL